MRNFDTFTPKTKISSNPFAIPRLYSPSHKQATTDLSLEMSLHLLESFISVIGQHVMNFGDGRARGGLGAFLLDVIFL